MEIQDSKKRFWRVILNIGLYIAGINILIALIDASFGVGKSPTGGIVLLLASFTAAYFAIRWGIEKSIREGIVEENKIFRISITMALLPIAVSFLFAFWSALSVSGSTVLLYIFYAPKILGDLVTSFISGSFSGIVTYILFQKILLNAPIFSKNVFIKIFTICAVVLLASAAAFAFLAGILTFKYSQGQKTFPQIQTQDKTANWQTYRNEEFGFEVKYPQDWTYKEETPQPQNFGINADFQDSEGKYVLSISSPIPETGFIGFEITEQKQVPTKNSAKFLEKTIYYFPEGDDYLILVQWSKDDWKNSGQISFSYEDKSDSNLMTLDQILSTFRFLEATKGETVDETAAWKTYKNEEFGFEFKYPTEFSLGEKTKADAPGLMDSNTLGNLQQRKSALAELVVQAKKENGELVAFSVVNKAKIGFSTKVGVYGYDSSLQQWKDFLDGDFENLCLLREKIGQSRAQEENALSAYKVDANMMSESYPRSAIVLTDRDYGIGIFRLCGDPMIFGKTNCDVNTQEKIAASFRLLNNIQNIAPGCD